MSSSHAVNPISHHGLESTLPRACSERPPMSHRAHGAPPSSRDGAATWGAPAPETVGLSGHIPALDGVRGLAIMMVMLLHFVSNTLPTNRAERVIIGATNYGSYGVDLFFILSGFLITGILYDSRDKPHYFRNFCMRRFKATFRDNGFGRL